MVRKLGMVALLAAAFAAGAGLEAKAGTITNVWPGITNVYAGPVTNNCQVKVTRKPEYKVAASSDANGSISGTTNSWCKTNDLISLNYTGNTGYELDHWTNVPSSVSAGNPSVSWYPAGADEKPWTNVFAVSKPKTFNYVFLDPIAGVGRTNNVTWGSNTNEVFSRYVINPTNDGIRYATEAIEATDVNVSTNSP